MEIIFCRYGGVEVILMVPHLFFSRFRTINSAPKTRFHTGARCGGAEVPTSVKGVLNPNFRPFSFELKKLDFLK